MKKTLSKIGFILALGSVTVSVNRVPKCCPFPGTLSWGRTDFQNKCLLFFYVSEQNIAEDAMNNYHCCREAADVFVFKEGDLCCPEDAHSEMIIPFV